MLKYWMHDKLRLKQLGSQSSKESLSSKNSNSSFNSTEEEITIEKDMTSTYYFWLVKQGGKTAQAA